MTDSKESPQLLIANGNVGYQQHLAAATTAAGLPTEIFRGWGGHLPEQMDAILATGASVIALQWPEAMCWSETGVWDQQVLDEMAAALGRLKDADRTLVWCMHNLWPHAPGNRDFWRALYQVFALYADGVMHHSHWGRDLACATYDFPTDQHVVLGHGYDHAITVDLAEREATRQSLQLQESDRLFVSIGVIREDKQHLDLVQFWQSRPVHEILLLAGNARGAYAESVLAAAAELPNVRIQAGHVANAEVGRLSAAADAMIFNHGQHHLTSGGPHLAQACLVTPIVPDVPYNREVLGAVGVFVGDTPDYWSALAVTLDDWTEQMGASDRQGVMDAMRLQRDPWSWQAIGRGFARWIETLPR